MTPLASLAHRPAAMHDYALEWTSDPATGAPKRMRWFVDGLLFHEQVWRRVFWAGLPPPRA